MEQHNAIRAWRRLCTRMLRIGCMVVACLAGTVACLQETNDGIAQQAPSPTARRVRDVRPTVTPATQRPATPAPPTPTFVPTDPQSPAPPSDPPAQQPSQGLIVYAGEEGVNLRTAPNQDKYAALLKDSFVSIRGAARDEGGFRWWPVAIEPGWMAERSRDPAQDPWLVPIDADRIAAGRQVRVVYPGKDGLNLRRTAGADGEKLATLLQGSLVTVVGGPQLVNGVAWWQVQVADGWLSEGTTDPSQPRWIALQP